SAQFVGRFLADQAQFGPWEPQIAVAQTQTVGTGKDARIRGVPAGDVADRLFKDPAQGGIGLTKLEFYSPRNGFNYFRREPSRFGTNKARHWDTLNMFPKGRPDVIDCRAVPNPPRLESTG